MGALLICPSERPSVRLLAETVPLAAVPALGQSLLEYWLVHLAASGIKEVTILADDRPEQIRAIAGDGARWGLKAVVISESRELTSAQVLLKYQTASDPSCNFIQTLDHFPGREQWPLFTSYAGWFEGVQAWMPHAKTADRVGVHEISPGIWTGFHAHISPSAQIHAPCWIGQHVFVGEGAVLGPGTVIEDGSFIERSAEISQSYVGAHTFVGRFSEIKDSVAWGNTLLNLKTGSFAKVPDPFMLCALRQPRSASSGGWFTRLADLYARNKEEVQMLWKQLVMNKEG
jgi:NDP-sugar pyrophosphorylase family protein